MFLADYHTHCLCSFDSSAPLVDMVQAALDAGMEELCLTDHCDLPEAKEQPNSKYAFRWEQEEQQLALARSRFREGIAIRTGIELGQPWEDPDFARRLLAHPTLDFVLGSVHILDPAHDRQDIYDTHYRDEATCHALLEPYFQLIQYLAESDFCDVLAHIIYPLRYMNARDGNHVTLERYQEQLRRILTTAIQTGKGIELNTYRGDTVSDWRELLTLYKECGGELITLGSDAHRPQDVAKGLREGAELLRSLGFRYVARYVGRKPEMMPL